MPSCNRASMFRFFVQKHKNFVHYISVCKYCSVRGKQTELRTKEARDHIVSLIAQEPRYISLCGQDSYPGVEMSAKTNNQVGETRSEPNPTVCLLVRFKGLHSLTLPSLSYPLVPPLSIFPPIPKPG